MERNYELNDALRVSIDSFTEERYQQFYAFFSNDTISVLDVGCNTGRGGRMLKTLNPRLEISGIDVVQERLDRLPADVYNRCFYGSAAVIPCESNYFDAVVAGEFIEHLYSEDIQKTLSEIFRVLKPRGRLLLTTPNPHDLKRRWSGGSILGGAHVTEHYPEKLKSQLKEIGFNKVTILGSGKVSRYLGDKFPLCIYGIYLAIAEKLDCETK